MKITQLFVSRTLFAFFAMFFVLPAPTTALAKNAYVSVINDDTKIRLTPSANGEVHEEVFAGFPLQIINSKGEWSEVVDFEGDTGWINNSTISPKKSVIIKAKKVDLLEAPNTEATNKVVVIARYGVTFTPLETREDWLKLRYEDGTEGWVKNDQIWPSKPFDTSSEGAGSSHSARNTKQSPGSMHKSKDQAKAKKTKAHHQ